MLQSTIMRRSESGTEKNEVENPRPAPGVLSIFFPSNTHEIKSDHFNSCLLQPRFHGYEAVGDFAVFICPASIS